MNKGVIACAMASVVVIGPFSGVVRQEQGPQQTSITGKITPETAVEFVRIIRGKDSLTATVISGNFFAKVKPGKYRLIVNTKTRGKDVYLDNLVVRPNQVLDIGEIILQ